MDGSDTLWQAVKNPFRNPYFAPLMSDDLDDLPAAYILLGTQDALYNDGVMYSDRLRAEGNDSVRVEIYESVHGMLAVPGSIADTAFNDMLEYMVEQLL